MEEKEKKERTVIHLYIKENDTHHYFGSIANVLNIFRLIYLGFPTVLYEITDYPTKKLFKTQSASFEKEPFCLNRGIGQKINSKQCAT